MQDAQEVVTAGRSEGGLFGRVSRALLLDADLYSEAKQNPGLTGEAIVAVLAAAILRAVPAMLHLHGFLSWAIAFLVFFVWTGIVTVVGNLAFGAGAKYGEMIRPLGYAYVPHGLAVLGVIPLLGIVVGPVSVVWAFIAGVVAVRQAMGLDNLGAFVTVLVSAAVIVMLAFLLVTVFGVGLISMAALLGAYH